MINHLTIRGFDPDTEAGVKALARNRNISMNKAVLTLIRRGMGLREDGQGPETVGHSLDQFIGSWSVAEERSFLKAVSDLNRVDESLWT